MPMPPSPNLFQKNVAKMAQSKFFRSYLERPYLLMIIWIWRRLPRRLFTLRPVRAYGVHLHHLVQRNAVRSQSTCTYFFRNRPELRLLTRLLEQKERGSTLDVTVLGCSKGAEVYSISYAIRCARPDMTVNLRALDISKDILEFAEAGLYSLKSEDQSGGSSSDSLALREDVAMYTAKDQPSSIFECMSPAEMEEMFEREEDQVRVKPRFREGISWSLGNAEDRCLVDAIGLQDVVVANRFLCHMAPNEAERCLRNLARLVKRGGYLFVSGVDLAVRSKVARELGWRPVTELIREIHEGDQPLRLVWPLNYWGLEPFDQERADWKLRYASVFQVVNV